MPGLIEFRGSFPENEGYFHEVIEKAVRRSPRSICVLRESVYPTQGVGRMLILLPPKCQQAGMLELGAGWGLASQGGTVEPEQAMALAPSHTSLPLVPGTRRKGRVRAEDADLKLVPGSSVCVEIHWVLT